MEVGFNVHLAIRNTFFDVVDEDAETLRRPRSLSDSLLGFNPSGSLCELGPIDRSSRKDPSSTYTGSLTIDSDCDSEKMDFTQDAKPQPCKSSHEGSLKTPRLSAIHAVLGSDCMILMPLDDEENPHHSPSNDSFKAHSDPTIYTACDKEWKLPRLDNKKQQDQADNKIEFDRMGSVGALLHNTGECEPCAWNWKPGGCKNGASCLFCHLCAEGVLKQRRKQLERCRKLERQARRGTLTMELPGTPLQPALIDGGAQSQPSMSVSKAALWQHSVSSVNEEHGYTEEKFYTAEGVARQISRPTPSVKLAKPKGAVKGSQFPI